MKSSAARGLWQTTLEGLRHGGTFQTMKGATGELMSKTTNHSSSLMFRVDLSVPHRLEQATLEGLKHGGTFQTSEGATVELIYCTAMWLQRHELSPDWQAILQTILQTVRFGRTHLASLAHLPKWQALLQTTLRTVCSLNATTN